MASSERPTYPLLPSKLVLMSTKSYFSPDHTVSYLKNLLDPSSGVIPIPNGDILFGFIPDFLSIYPCAAILSEHAKSTSTSSKHPQLWPLHLGAQDCFWSSEYGAYTGEIVPLALQSLGVTIVELGHAERRKMLAETDETTAKKAAAVSKLGMVPLVCIGEIAAPDLQGPMSAAVGNAMKQLNSQVTSLLSAVPLDAPVIFAYEPVWAIGADQPAPVDHVRAVAAGLRSLLDGHPAARLIYGGTAGPGLFEAIREATDGLFLGRRAHDPAAFAAVLSEVAPGH